MRQLLYFAVILLCLLSVSCNSIHYKYIYTDNRTPAGLTPKRVVPIYVDKQFSNQDKLSIDNAVGQWNYVLNGQIVLTVVDYNFDMEPEVLKRAQKEHAFLFLKVHSDFPGIPDDLPESKCRVTPNCSLTLAWVDRIGGTVMKVVRNRINADDMQYVVLHEVGHLLYLQHDKDPKSLMYHQYSKFGYLCVDRDSALRVAKVYALDFNHMNYCSTKY